MKQKCNVKLSKFLTSYEETFLNFASIDSSLISFDNQDSINTRTDISQNIVNIKIKVLTIFKLTKHCFSLRCKFA